MNNLIPKFIVVALVLLTGVMNLKAEKYTIGFSQCNTSDLWRQNQLRMMEIELSFHPDMQMIVKDARDNSGTQIEQIEDLIKEGIDLLIVSPVESAPITPIVEKVYKSGIPVIVLDRKIESDFYTAFIGGDNYSIGIEAGNYAAKLLNGSGNIVEIRGLDGSSPAKERKQGFMDAISRYPDIRVVESVAGNWNSTDGRNAFQQILDKGVDFELVYAHNDVMAKEAYAALARTGKGKKFILGVDGLPGKDGGVQMVISGIIDATFLYQNGGSLAIQTANKILTGQPFSLQSIIPTITIDASNAQMIKSQNDQIEILQNKIERQKLILAIEQSRNRTQKILLYSLIIVSILATALTVLIFVSLRNKKRSHAALEQKNREIEDQNAEIKKQHKKLLAVSKQLEEATQAKLTFFTNISHEFRTPLTLLKGPLENMLEDGNLTEEQHKTFRNMYKNASRLLLMVNQLMDFREMENKKLGLEAGEYDIVHFVSEVKDSFATYAESRNIALKLSTSVKSLPVWFDYDKIDKVLFNLLSNAFKFTPEGGSIEIRISKNPVPDPGLFTEEVRIDVSDTGVGIPAKNLKKIFERFYHSENSKGTGIGLQFSKELIDLHRGRITVKSEEGQGATFSFFLPLGNLHLLEKEMTAPDKKMAEKREQVVLFDDEQQPEEKAQDEPEKVEKPLILVVDDIPEVRTYIIQSLGKNYQTIESHDGADALKKVAEFQPDLVLSDVMMPQMDGFELTREIKSGSNTEHIPVILLTAKAEPENKLEGLETGADAFIEKPFKRKYLRATVNNLLESRIKLRSHYRDALDYEDPDQKMSRVERKFLEEIRNMVLQNIGKEEMSVDEISTRMGVSRVHLYRKVKKLTNMSVSEYVTSVKLKKSLELLRNSGKTISEIAYEMGFSSPSYYTRCFKDQFKMSPSNYIQQNRRVKTPEPAA